MAKGVTFERNQGPVKVLTSSARSRASILGKLIEIIACAETESLDLSRIPAEIDHKIKFNDLVNHLWLVDEYVSSSMLVDQSILELNQKILNGSTKLKRQMKLFYQKALTAFSICTNPFDITKLRQQSDNVVADVIERASEFVKSSDDLKEGYYEEDIEYGVALITSYAIIECIVLENPNDHN